MKNLNVCLDSGAFTIYQKCIKEGNSSAYHKTKDYKKYLEEYISFVHQNLNQLEFYVNLDVIHNSEATYDSQCYMESQGLNPLPVFHFGEDFSYLKKYMESYDYIGLGGVAKGVNKKDLIRFFDQVFAYTKDQNIRFHGLGITDAQIMKRYKWFSLDSTSLMQPAIFGGIFFPQTKVNGDHDYLGNLRYVRFTERSQHARDYFERFPPLEQKSILRYIKALGIEPSLLKININQRILCNIHFFEGRLEALKKYHLPHKVFDIYIAGFWGYNRKGLCGFSQNFRNLGWLVSFAAKKHCENILDIKKAFTTERKRKRK